ncbi:MAG: D-alanyl-D-alanine endopeptidase [Betaproteobacteria bacterium]|nr:D-alanyl-D-alanine endopeptidase [Betaproteobacteria bacterium]
MIRILLVVFIYLVGSTSPALAGAEGTSRDPAKLHLESAIAIIVDAENGQSIYSKAAHDVTPIASLTKLMTAMVVLDSKAPLDELLNVDLADFDFLKGSRSRLRMGTSLPRAEMLRLALMSSENRAASTLARHHPGGMRSFVAAMNAKAVALGMAQTRFEDSTGLSPTNVSTANDLARLVRAAALYPLIREYSTTEAHFVDVDTTGQMLGFNNSNALVKKGDWDIQLQKTGYIREAGRCVVLLAMIASRPMVIVLLDSFGKYSRIGDAQRVKHWLETGDSLPAPDVRTRMKNAVKAFVVKTRSAKEARNTEKSRGKPIKGTFPPRLVHNAKVRGA